MGLPGNSFSFSYSGPYRAISASISFKRSSPLLPGMPTPGPGTTGPPATGSPGAGPAPAIADAMAFSAPSSRRRGFYGRVPVSSGWEPTDDVRITATDARREDVGLRTGAETWPHPQDEYKPIRVSERQGPGRASRLTERRGAGRPRPRGGRWANESEERHFDPPRCGSRNFEEARKFGGPSRSL